MTDQNGNSETIGGFIFHMSVQTKNDAYVYRTSSNVIVTIVCPLIYSCDLFFLKV